MTKWTYREAALASGAAPVTGSLSLLLDQEGLHLPHDLKRIRRIQRARFPLNAKSGTPLGINIR